MDTRTAATKNRVLSATHTTTLENVFFYNVVDELKDMPYSCPEDELQQIEFLNAGIILAKLKYLWGKLFIKEQKKN